MAVLSWDNIGERYFETGVDRGVLYIPNGSGVYDNGVAWNGLTTVTETPSGAEGNAQYADNIKYLNLISAEEFGATIEAFTYPPEFSQFDGSVIINGGVILGQQTRKSFGFSYRTKVGNDVGGADLGYKHHLVYGAQAAPSEKAYTTVNDSPEALTFSWELTTTPALVTGQKPTSILTIDSTKSAAAGLTALQNAIWGTAGTSPRLPTPDEVIAMFAGTLTSVQPLTTPPTYNAGTRTITLPATTGIVWRVNGIVRTGTHVIGVGEYGVVKATPANGYVFPTYTQDSWTFGPGA